jgi:DNA-binding PadR family transcriptional regulator
MDIFSKYMPMTETAYLILLALKEELHGYGVIQKVDKLTEGRIHLGPGTVYGTLSRMESDGVIISKGEFERKKLYVISNLGSEILAKEITRLGLLYKYGVGEQI